MANPSIHAVALSSSKPSSKAIDTTAQTNKSLNIKSSKAPKKRVQKLFLTGGER